MVKLVMDYLRLGLWLVMIRLVKRKKNGKEKEEAKKKKKLTSISLDNNLGIGANLVKLG